MIIFLYFLLFVIVVKRSVSVDSNQVVTERGEREQESIDVSSKG